MSHSFLEFLNLTDSFTKDDLDNSYTNKMNDIDNMAISSIDKKYYKKYVERAYYKALKYLEIYSIMPADEHTIISKNNIFSDLLSNFGWNSNNKKNHSHSVQRSFSQVLNPDRSYTITELSVINKNGKVEKIEKKYKKYPDGTIEYLKN